ncbi:hypothetical protein T05_12916 [Trichinella murrelli]|uniref:Uncharacterized protein n=1 Tax=Trichinella murrelli TaxID=144512 RepID=A0A0V0T202_9BILA|nr:hypothetical protein T05_12916 [Trichinella murrelli]
MECLVGSMNKSLRYNIIQVLLAEREQLSTSNPTLKYDETQSVVPADVFLIGNLTVSFQACRLNLLCYDAACSVYL